MNSEGVNICPRIRNSPSPNLGYSETVCHAHLQQDNIKNRLSKFSNSLRTGTEVNIFFKEYHLTSNHVAFFNLSVTCE